MASLLRRALKKVGTTTHQAKRSRSHIFFATRRFGAATKKGLAWEIPSTMDSDIDLANRLFADDKLEEAEPLFKKCLKGFEKLYGAEHPDTLAWTNNLAVLLKKQGKFEEAEPLYRKSLLVQKNAFGEEHPDTLGMTNNLAALLEKQGKLEEAEFLHRKCLVGQKKCWVESIRTRWLQSTIWHTC